jgi:flagellar motility protein MotE (MotC chaperone)
MRAPAVLLNVVIAGALSGFAGYTIAHREGQQAIAALRQEHHAALLREQEVRAQLETALAARAALEQQSQHLQAELNERLRRLEELAAQLTPPPVPSEENSTGDTEASEPQRDGTP